jgi:hypothetical protein
VRFHAEPTRLVVNDPEALVEWCQTHLTDAVQVRVEATGAEAIELQRWTLNQPERTRAVVGVGRREVNSYFSSSGDLPDGTEVIPSHDVLSIKEI